MLALEEKNRLRQVEMLQEDARAAHFQQFSLGIEGRPAEDLQASIQEFIAAAPEFSATRTQAGELAIQAVANEAIRRQDASLFDVFNQPGPDGVVIAKHPTLGETLEKERAAANRAISAATAGDRAAENLALQAKLEQRASVPVSELQEHVREGRLTQAQAFSLHKRKLAAATKAAEDAEKLRFARQFPFLADKADVQEAIESDITHAVQRAVQGGQELSLDDVNTLRIQHFAAAGVEDPKHKRLLQRGAVAISRNPQAFIQAAQVYIRAQDINPQYAASLTTESERAIYDAFHRRTVLDGEPPEEVVQDLAGAGERVSGVINLMRVNSRAVEDDMRRLDIGGTPALRERFRKMVQDSLVFGEAVTIDDALDLARDRWEERMVSVGNGAVDGKHFGGKADAADRAFRETYFPDLKERFPVNLEDSDADDVVLLEDEQTARDGTLRVIDTANGQSLERIAGRDLVTMHDKSVREEAIAVARETSERIRNKLSDSEWMAAQATELAEEHIRLRGLDPKGPAAARVMEFWSDRRRVEEALKQGMQAQGIPAPIALERAIDALLQLDPVDLAPTLSGTIRATKEAKEAVEGFDFGRFVMDTIDGVDEALGFSDAAQRAERRRVSETGPARSFQDRPTGGRTAGERLRRVLRSLAPIPAGADSRPSGEPAETFPLN